MVSYEKVSRRQNTALEFQLVEDGKVLFRVPLRAHGEMPEMPLQMNEDDIEKLVSLYSIASNGGRLRMMFELATRDEVKFSDLLEFTSNPKMVHDCLKPMMEEGMLEHEERGPYRSSVRGAALAITMTAGLAKLLEVLEEEVEGDEDE